MANKKQPNQIRIATINKNKTFLNACIQEINDETFVLTNLVKAFSVNSSLFYNAVDLNYFEKNQIRPNKCIYKPNVKKISFDDAYKITLETYKQVENSKAQKQIIDASTTIKTSQPEMKVTLPTKGIQVVKKPLSEIKFTHLQSETDEDLIAELKRRGYQGTIEIKKQVTL